jgi:hypothetical protein
MEILKQGPGPKVWSGEYECTGFGNNGNGCGSILLVQKSDLYETYNSDMYGEVYATHITFMCPVCGAETDIKAPREVSAGIPGKESWLQAHPGSRRSS